MKRTPKKKSKCPRAIRLPARLLRLPSMVQKKIWLFEQEVSASVLCRMNKDQVRSGADPHSRYVELYPSVLFPYLTSDDQELTPSSYGQTYSSPLEGRSLGARIVPRSCCKKAIGAMNLAIAGGLRARNGTPFPFPRSSFDIKGLDCHDNRAWNSPESPRDTFTVASTTRPARSSETVENTVALRYRLAPSRVDYLPSTKSRLQDAVVGIILHMQLQRSTVDENEKVPCLSVKLASVPTLHALADKFWDNCFDLLDHDEGFKRIEVKVDNESGTIPGVHTDFSVRMHGRSPDKSNISWDVLLSDLQRAYKSNGIAIESDLVVTAVVTRIGTCA